MNVMTENKVVPKLRFSFYNSNWGTKLYGDIYSFYSTNSLSRDNLNYKSGKVFNIHYGDIHTKFATMFDLNKELTPFVNVEVDLSKYSEEKYCKDGDLVIADASEGYEDIGKTIELINLNNERVLAGLHTFLARPNKYEMAIGFAGYLMQSWSVKKQVMVIAQGSKVLGISTGRLGKIKLFIPEYKEQQKIASFLSAVDKKLQQLTKKKELLKEYEKGIIQKIFSQELCFKDDNGNNFPDWEEKKFTELLKLFSSSQVKNSEMLIEGKYPVIEQGKKESLNYSNDENKLIKNECVIVYGDHTTVIKFIDFNFVAGPSVKLLKALNKSDLKYLYYNLCYNNIKPEGYKRHFSILKKIYLQLPNLEEQKKIANFLSAVDNKIDLVSTQIENTKAFKKGLLQQMFV